MLVESLATFTLPIKGVNRFFDQNALGKTWKCRDIKLNRFSVIQWNDGSYALTDIEKPEELPLHLEVLPRFEIVPHRFYQHKVTGEKASIFSSALGEDWELKTEGFTVHDNKTNTRGAPSLPVPATMAECEEHIKKRLALTPSLADFI